MTDLQACKQLLMRLQRGGSVTARELKHALAEEQWTDYQLLREGVKGLRERAKTARYELRDYVRMLRIADLHYAQPNRNITPRCKRKLLLDESTKYERALECLLELLKENSSLDQYLDRSPYGDIDPDEESVPRLWFSESALPPSEQGQILTIRELKKEALERAIEALSAPPAVTKKRNLKTPPPS